MKNLAFLIVLWYLVSCKKKDSSPTIDFGAGAGISLRAADGRVAGSQDPTDWTSDATWNEQERALFPDLAFDLNGAQQPTRVSYTYAYPNPALTGQANWLLQLERSYGSPAVKYSLSAVLVDRKYQVLLRLGPSDFSDALTYSLDYTKIGLRPNELYRLYYVLYYNGVLLYKGHGDIRHSS
ncbi:hypothetical protein [Hymenobacter sp. AT01-02]|uniref:hypothetical protein n=1 Tax=Hymenobacter sp. AT01-02 TaxID=1571877 RepID=UPI0005F253EE|nr:hypothetical protein [Hymenobacter sp. AT01-02]